MSACLACGCRGAVCWVSIWRCINRKCANYDKRLRQEGVHDIDSKGRRLFNGDRLVHVLEDLKRLDPPSATQEAWA